MGAPGIGPGTSFLSGKRSTTEPRTQILDPHILHESRHSHNACLIEREVVKKFKKIVQKNKPRALGTGLLATSLQ